MAYDHRKVGPALTGRNQVIVQPAQDAANRMTFIHPQAAHMDNGTVTHMERKASAKNSADLD